MNTQKQNNAISGDIRKEFLQIEALRENQGKGNLGEQTFTKNTGGFLTLICC